MGEKESIEVVNDQVGSPTYAANLAKAILQMVEPNHFVPGTYHYSNEGSTSWYYFAYEIKTLIQSKCTILPVSSDHYKTAASRPAYSLLDKSKIKKVYGLQIPDWKSSLAVCIEQLKKR